MSEEDKEELLESLGEGPTEGRGAKVEEPEEKSWGDKMIKTRGELRHKHEVVAHMLASGMSHKQIAQDLNYTQSRVSIIASNTQVKNRVKEIQAEYWGGNIEKRFRSAVPKAMGVFEETLDDPNAKDTTKLHAAQWLLEKVTGKPKQEVDIGENTLSLIMDQLDQMRGPKDVGPAEGGALLIEAEVKRDEEQDWVTDNIPKYNQAEKGEKSE